MSIESQHGLILFFPFFRFWFLFSRFLNIEFSRGFYFRESPKNREIAKISTRENFYV